MTTMPTSDADRYAQLLQNLAVRIGAIREAIERAFGATLPTAPTLKAEFEIITSAIYAAADRPRPVPLTDDKPNTRTHFVYRIDIWTDDGKNIVEHLAGLENLIVARAAYRAACDRWPHARITLRQGSRVVEYSAETIAAYLISAKIPLRKREQFADRHKIVARLPTVADVASE